MHIYVESRGFAPDDDYCWLQVTEKSQQRTEKEELPPILRSAIKLIDSEDYSVVLYREDGKILLLVTGFQSEGRVDFVERQIRISVAWFVEDSEDNERVLRMLACNALESEKAKLLTEEISQAVTLGGESGFMVDFLTIVKIADKGKAKDLLLDELADPTKKLAVNSPERRKQLSEELKKCRLPSESAPLVVVTGIKKEETLVNAGVWRGLSSLVKEKDWQTMRIPPSNDSYYNKLLEYLNRLANMLGIVAASELFIKLLKTLDRKNP